MRRYLILMAVLAFALTACRVESNIILDIGEDGSALVGAELGFDEEFRQLLGDNDVDPDDLFGGLPDLGTDDVVQTERTEGDMTFVGIASNVDDLSSFDAGSAQAEAFSNFSYLFDDSSARLEASVDAQDIGELGGEGLPIDPSQLTDEFFSANVIVTMPGTVTEHNADEVRSDGTLVWKIPFTGSTEIIAASEFGSSSSSWILLIVLAVVIVGVIAAAVATIVSRRESKNAVAAAAASHGSGDDAEVSELGDVDEATPTDGTRDSGSPQDQSTDDAEVEADGTDDDVNP